jgi:hypothetical protein
VTIRILDRFPTRGAHRGPAPGHSVILRSTRESFSESFSAVRFGWTKTSPAARNWTIGRGDKTTAWRDEVASKTGWGSRACSTRDGRDHRFVPPVPLRGSPGSGAVGEAQPLGSYYLKNL